ncbi:capsid assembly scaffolding protein Gp46 family protein [Kitasatospora sp. Ki12]
MTHEHQAAYWKHHARKHEQRAASGPTAEELTQLRADAAELATRKAAELSETDRLKAEKETAEAAAAQAKADAATATRRALLLEVAGAKGLTADQASRLQGDTREQLEADADALKTAFGNAGITSPPPSGGNRGGDVGGGTTVQAGADLYRQRHART